MDRYPQAVREATGKRAPSRERTAAETARSFGGDVFAAVRRASEDATVAQAVAEADTDALNDFDRWSVIHDGIVAWSDARKVNAPNREDLDEQTVEVVARRILALSLPARDEASRKNG